VQQGSERLFNVERDWRTMILIAHDFFHCWRNLVRGKYGDSAAEELTLKFWEEIGKNTAQQYIIKGRIDPEDVEQVVNAVARSSGIMGETVRVEKDGDAFLLIHDACPWIDSYVRAGSAGQCQKGCDRWFAATLSQLSPRLMVKTLSCLAAGDAQCLRRFSKKVM